MLNQQNKQGFIELLSQQLQKANISVKHSDDDADLLIVQTVLEMAEQHTVPVIGEDTALLVLLHHHSVLFATCEEKSNMKCTPKIWDIAYAQNKLGDELCEALLAIHAMLGWVTGGTAREKTLDELRYSKYNRKLGTSKEA